MRCPACAQDNPEGARFCNACGTPLSTIPSERLASLRAFIPSDVANKIMTAGGLGERRIVTVLSCDVVGSTGLGERLGPERFKVVMDQVLGRIITAVARYEGTVAQVMGDGLLAFFGAPLAHEDDADRAVRAALDIREAIASYSKDLEDAYRTPLQVRVGLNTGPIVLSHVTDVLEVAYNALGDTVTTAARLQSAAQPGTVLAAAGTARLVGDLFETRPAGPFLLKGKEAPVSAMEVLEARALAAKFRGIAGLSAPMVGREQEMAVLAESVQAITEGRGQIVALIGEPGIGKSRLVEEVRKAHPEVRWLEGRCLSYGENIPYFPFIDLLREWLGVTALDHDAKVRIELGAAVERLFGAQALEVYPYLGAMLRLSLEPEAAARIAGLSGESLQHQTVKVMREWTARSAERQPLGLIFDDLHWADGASLTLLESLFEVAEEAPVLFSMLFRAEREHGAWRVNFAADQRYPHRHVEIILKPLSPTDTQELVADLLGQPEFPVEMREAILQKAEGNPFFVEEVIRSLIEEGILVREENRWRATRPAAAIAVPDSIQGVLLSRIDRLPPEARQVLQAAAVIGRLFPLELVKDIAPGDGKVEDALVHLQRHDLIVERRRIPQAEYRFKHALTQEVAYGTLTDEQRRRFHGGVARALERRHEGRLEEVYGVLAYHYDQARDEAKALHFLIRAGDKARAEYADAEALQHYRRAVELLKHRGDSRAAADVLMKMGLAHHIAFDFRAASLAYREAFDLLASSASTAAPRLPATTVSIGFARDPFDLDSARMLENRSAYIGLQMFEGLLQHAPDMNVRPALARSWEISDDGMHYVIHLHRDRLWSDGRPVTAGDFVFSWLRALRGEPAHVLADIAGARRYSDGVTDDPGAVGVRALDDYTLDVRLEGPRSYFPYVLAHQATLPQPRWVVEPYGAEWTRPEHIVVNGPYRMVEWVPESHILLTQNAGYAGRGGGNARDAYINLRTRDSGPFEDGTVDVIPGALVTPNRQEVLREYVRNAGGGTVFIAFRCGTPPFNDRRVRQAFAYAVDRQGMGPAISAYRVVADGGLVPPDLPGHSPNIALPFAPEKARELLAQAGFPGGRGLGPVSLASQMPRPAGAYLRRAWHEILGVEVTDVATRWEELKRIPREERPHMMAFGWSPDYPDPDSFLRLIFHSTAPSNLGWADTRFDALVEDAQASIDQRRRMALYHEADRLLVEEAGVIPLTYTRRTDLVRPWIKGWWATSLAWAPIADIVIEEKVRET